MAATIDNRILIRFQLSYPKADFIFAIFDEDASGTIGGLRPMKNALEMRPLESMPDAVEKFFGSLKIPHITYYQTPGQSDADWEEKVIELQSQGYLQMTTMRDGKIISVQNLGPMMHQGKLKSAPQKPPEIKLRVTVDWTIRPDMLRKLEINPENFLATLKNAGDANWNSLSMMASSEIVEKRIIRA